MLKKLKSGIVQLIRDESGASAIEYGLIAALIAALIIVSVTGIGTNIQAKFVSVCESLNGGAACDA